MKKGFTMIELIFVIVILGVLASVAIPRLAGTKTDAEVATAVANLRTLVDDAGGYYTVNDEFGAGDTGAKWSEFTNVPLNNSNGVASTSEGIIKIAGQNCIRVQVQDGTDNIPAHILVSKDGTNKNSGICKEVLAAAPIQAYFDSRVKGVEGLNDDKGAIPIGSGEWIEIASAAGSTPSAGSTGSSSTTPSTPSTESTPSKPSKPSTPSKPSRPTPAVSTANGPATVTIVVPAEKPTTTPPKPPHSAVSMDGSTVIHGSGNGSGNKDAVNSILGAQQQRPGGSGGSVATIGGQSSQQVSKEEEEAANKEWIDSGKRDEDMEKFKDALQQMMGKK